MKTPRGMRREPKPTKASMTAAATAAARLVSKPGRRALEGKEKRDRLRADKMLNALCPIAVSRLGRILRSFASTNMDVIAASREVLDRKFPKLTSAEVALRDFPGIELRMGQPWPKTEAETQQRLMVHSFGEAHVAGFDAAAVLHAAMKAATNGSADA
jgi:hypothetical protein